MAEETIDKRIDEGTFEAFEAVCSVLGHDVIGQFSIFDGAWQVIMLAVADGRMGGDLSPEEQTQLKNALTETMPQVKAVMQISQDIRVFLFPQMWMMPDGTSQTGREYNQDRWAPYNRAAWNTFFAGVREQIARAESQLDEIEKRIDELRAMKIEQAVKEFSHFEPMLATNLRKRLATVIDRYTIKPEHSG